MHSAKLHGGCRDSLHGEFTCIQTPYTFSALITILCNYVGLAGMASQHTNTHTHNKSTKTVLQYINTLYVYSSYWHAVQQQILFLTF